MCIYIYIHNHKSDCRYRQSNEMDQSRVCKIVLVVMPIKPRSSSSRRHSTSFASAESRKGTILSLERKTNRTEFVTETNEQSFSWIFGIPQPTKVILLIFKSISISCDSAIYLHTYIYTYRIYIYTNAY